MKESLKLVCDLWRDLTNAEAGFGEPLIVVESLDHRSAPDGWVSVVRIDDATVVSAPPGQIERVRAVIESARPELLADHVGLASFVRPAETLGPARLFYDRVSQRPESAGVIGPLSVDDEGVTEVLGDASDDERNEADLENTTSGIYVALDDHRMPAAICGWREWPHNIAHIGVLCASSKRGTGAARRAGNQALRSAGASGLLAQWRAAEENLSSIHLARSLGLSEIGSQLSFKFQEI